MSESSPAESSPTPGPNTPTKSALPDIGPIPGPPVNIGNDVSLETLTPEEIRARLAARERDMKYHVAALKHEALTVADDVNIGGRPLMDIIRAQPLRAAAIAVGSGALLGLLIGLRSRAKRRPVQDDDIDFVRARLAFSVEDAARRVARGDETEHALRASMRTMPVIYGEASGPAEQARRSTNGVIDVVIKSALGFAAKAAADQLTQKLTGHEETFAAVADAAESS